MTVRAPKYRRHSSGNAFVEVEGRRIYLGPYGSEKSKEAYRRIVAELMSGSLPIAIAKPADGATVSELILNWLGSTRFSTFAARFARTAATRSIPPSCRTPAGTAPISTSANSFN